MIVILGIENEPHANRVASYLSAKNEEFIFFDTQKYPNEVLIDWEATEINKGAIVISDKRISLNDIKSVYWRNFSDVKYEVIPDGDNTDFLSSMLERERRSALHSLFYSLVIKVFGTLIPFFLNKLVKYAFFLCNSKAFIELTQLISNE